MRIQFHKPSIGDEDIKAVTDVLRSGWLTAGQQVEEFEGEFAKYVGAHHAIAVNSCTAALHIALYLAGVRQGSEVITSPITFPATANAIRYLDATPVFADVLDDMTIDPESVRKCLTPLTRAIVPVHFAGLPCRMQELREVAASPRTGRVPIIADAAHAVETLYQGRNVARQADLNCYSFYATKNITSGEGGMLTTDDSGLAALARTLRTHGIDKNAWERYGDDGYHHWDQEVLGWKYNMSDLQAALGLSQLRKIDYLLRRREEVAHQYITLLQREPRVEVLQGPPTVTNLGSNVSALHLFPILVAKRDQVMDLMQKRGVGVGVHFRAVHKLTYYRRLLKTRVMAIPECPVADQASEELLSLPFYPALRLVDVADVVATLTKVLDELGVAPRAVRL